MNPDKKIVIVTGGSRGFGTSLAKSFIEAGSTVIIASKHEEELIKAAEELGADSHVADVTDFEAVQRLADYGLQKYGQIDIWINNAGIQIAPSLAEDVSLEKLRHLFDVNFFGYFYGCQSALRIMKKQGHGCIMNISSTAGLDGKPQLSAYVSSKFAIKGLTESIRKELDGTGVSMYGVYPGGMQTDIYHEQYPADLDEYMLVDSVSEKVVKNLQAESPELDLVIKRPQTS